MDTEKADKSRRLKSFAIVCIIALLVVLCGRMWSELQDYMEAYENSAWAFNLERSRILQDYASHVFPKYIHQDQGGQQQLDSTVYYYEFSSILDPADTMSFGLPFYGEYRLPDEPGVYVNNMDFSQMGVLGKDLAQQDDLPQLEDGKTYMLTARLTTKLEQANDLGYPRLDDFRKAMYYDEKAVNVAGPGGPPDERYQYQKQKLQIWYGLTYMSSTPEIIVVGIDEETAFGKISAEQVAAEYCRILYDRIADFNPGTSFDLNFAAECIETEGGYVQCLLLTGTGEAIKEYLAYAENAGYIVSPLRVLDSL